MSIGKLENKRGLHTVRFVWFMLFLFVCNLSYNPIFVILIVIFCVKIAPRYMATRYTVNYEILVSAMQDANDSYSNCDYLQH